MQLSDILTVEQLGAMREMAKQPSDASIHAPFLSEQAIGLLCAFVGRKCNTHFWVRLKSEYTYIPSVMVCVQGKNVEVMPVHKSVIFAKHLGDMLKRETKICWVRDGWVSEVNWENWKRVYNALTTEPKHDNLSEPPSKRELRRKRIDRDRDEMFYEAASVVRNKKMNKRGYNMSFDEVRAQMRHEAYEKRLRGVEMEARNILRVL